jgi:hypothetical protein
MKFSCYCSKVFRLYFVCVEPKLFTQRADEIVNLSQKIIYKYIYKYIRLKCKGKAVPLQAWTGPEGSRSLRHPDFLTSVHEGGRLSALRTGRLYPKMNLVLVFRGWVDPRAHGTVRCHGKTPETPGIDPGTLRLVAQCLNHYDTPGPLYIYIYAETVKCRKPANILAKLIQ